MRSCALPAVNLRTCKMPFGTRKVPSDISFGAFRTACGEFCARSTLVFFPIIERCIKSFSVSLMTYNSPVWIWISMKHEDSLGAFRAERAMSTHASFERCWWRDLEGPPRYVFFWNLCLNHQLFFFVFTCSGTLTIAWFGLWPCDFPSSSWFYRFWDRSSWFYGFWGR